MDFTSAKTKEEILSLIDDPSTGGLAFSGWDRYGTPKLNADGIQQSIRTLMEHKAYDPDIEQKILSKLSQYSPELRDIALNTGMALRPGSFKFSPEAKPSPWHFGMPTEPPKDNLLNIKKKSLGTKMFGGLLGLGD